MKFFNTTPKKRTEISLKALNREIAKRTYVRKETKEEVVFLDDLENMIEQAYKYEETDHVDN